MAVAAWLVQGVPAAPVAHAADRVPPINVLLLDARPVLDAEVRTRLEARGVQVVLRKSTQPLSDEMLRSFHVVLLPAFHGLSVESFFIVPHEILRQQLALQRNLDVLRRYVLDGGGLLVMPSMLGSGRGTATSVSEFLAPFGARLHALQIRDTAHLFAPYYAWTDAITRHPATEGVKTLFYPHNMLRWDDGYATPALELVAPEWVVLARGMPQSVASSGIDYKTWVPSELKEPVLAAARDVGRGRLGLLTVNSFYVFRSPFAKVPRGWIGESNVGEIDGIFVERGDGTTPSQGLVLVSGLLHWLAEPARRAGFGDYDEVRFNALSQPSTPVVPHWLQTWTPDSGTVPQQTLLGARSTFSDGAGTIEEYARAARDSGLAVLIMTETFEKFDPARWDAFTAACAAASDATLAVLPGFDIADIHGTRYLYFGRRMVFPNASLLTTDGLRLEKTQYLSLGLGSGTAVIHRPGTNLHHPHQLLKHYHGLSVFTYRDGRLVDDGREAYRWQVGAFSNPMPFVTHEVFSPAALAQAAGVGHQLYVMAPDSAAAAWYLGEVAGLAHFYESPLRLQISAGPLITELRGKNLLQITSAVPLREVRLRDRGQVIRRWRPDGSVFTLPQAKLPAGHKTWLLVEAEDEQGHTALSPGLIAGRDSKWGYTWRCGDRQNWTHPFISLYTGQEIFHFDIRLPGAEQAGDLAAIHDFRLASWVTYVQDTTVSTCYPDATWNDYARDAKPVPRTVPIAGYRGKIRFRQFYHPRTVVWNRPHTNNLPTLKSVELELLQSLQPTGAVFPQIVSSRTRSDTSREPVTVGDSREYAFTDPASGEGVHGTLTEGTLDLPSGGRIGGLIALSDGLRVTVKGEVGFAPPADTETPLPAGTRWRAEFVTVAPERAEAYRSLMGLAGAAPYKIDMKQGTFDRLHYIAYCTAAAGGVHGEVTDPWVGGEYPLPVAVGAVNPAWEAVFWRPGGTYRTIPVFEGEAWARLDVGVSGPFYIGHPVLCGAPQVALGVLHWSDDRLEVEVHNPTDAAVETDVWTAAAISDRQAFRGSVVVAAGSSQVVVLRAQP